MTTWHWRYWTDLFSNTGP